MESGSEDTPVFVNQPAVPSVSRTTAPAKPAPPAVPNLPAQAGTPADTKAPLTAAAALEGDSLADADPEILSEFITETLDHLQISETSLLKLETDPDDKENLNTVFRAFHSTKGTSSFLGLNRIKELAHHGEMLLDRARKGEIQLTGIFADLALESADTLKWMIQTLQDTSTGPRKPLPANYQDLMRRLENPGVPFVAPIIPTTVEIKPETSPVIHDAPERPCNDAMANALSQGASAAAVSTVRVSTEKLDGLINMVGELVITHAMIAQQEGAREENQQNRMFSRNIAQLEKITRELQDLSMSLRMVPLKATFQKMERLVRDVAKKSQKTSGVSDGGRGYRD
jgi:two-component system chemotaxis sensor kinase CheA